MIRNKIKFYTSDVIMNKINDYERNLQDSIRRKMEDTTSELTDQDINAYEMTKDDEKIGEYIQAIINGETFGNLTINDFLASPQAKVLIPKILIGKARKAAEPVYLASQFFEKIRIKSGNAIQFPTFGVMRAHDVAEGQEIPAETIDWNTHLNGLIKVGKSGLRIQYSEELFKDIEFPLVNMLSEQAGRAMARHKEQKAFVEFESHGHVLYDNELAKRDPIKYKDVRTTGVDYENNLNDTMSIDDYLNLIICVYNNGFTPTDLIIHPLAWPAFVKNGFTGGLSASFDRESKRALPNGKVNLGPGAISGKLPFDFTANISHFCPIDRRNKTFDMFCVDKNNIGVLLQKDDLKTENFVDPARDITNIKWIERYGYGVHHEGRAIVMARNISMAKSFPLPERIITINK